MTDEPSNIDKTTKSTTEAVITDPDMRAALKHLSETAAEESPPVNIQNLTPERIKNIVEAAILAAAKAISLDKILSLFPETEAVSKDAVRQAIEQLMQDYQSRGIELIEVSSGFRFQVTQTVAPWVSRLWEERPQKYSRALLETLALVAYRQPVTRGEIEEIRGVSVSSQIMRTLVEREWVRIIGHRDVPGKPAMYATTKSFLDYFGLKKLDELPTLSEIRDLDVINAELDFGEFGNDESGAGEPDSTAIEQGEPDSQDKLQSDTEVAETEQRIDIDAELNALRETYQKMDEQQKKNADMDADDSKNKDSSGPKQ